MNKLFLKFVRYNLRVSHFHRHIILISQICVSALLFLLIVGNEMYDIRMASAI
jgi:hypothetical protein